MGKTPPQSACTITGGGPPSGHTTASAHNCLQAPVCRPGPAQRRRARRHNPFHTRVGPGSAGRQSASSSWWRFTGRAQGLCSRMIENLRTATAWHPPPKPGPPKQDTRRGGWPPASLRAHILSQSGGFNGNIFIESSLGFHKESLINWQIWKPLEFKTGGDIKKPVFIKARETVAKTVEKLPNLTDKHSQ